VIEFSDAERIIDGFLDSQARMVSETQDNFDEVTSTVASAFSDLENNLAGFRVVTDWEAYLEEMKNKAVWLRDELVAHSIWTDMLDEMVHETERGMKEINAVAGRGFSSVSAGSSRVPVSPAALGGASGGGSVEIVIKGPLVNVEGSVDRRTAELAADMVKKKLGSVIVEATSSGVNVKTKRVRW